MAALAFVGPASAAGRLVDGVYSNVCLYSETDDLGGFEVVLRHVGEQARVGIVVCEGGCWRGVVSSVARSGSGLAFVVTEALVDEHGQPVKPIITRYRVRPLGRSVILSSAGDPEPIRAVLRPQRRAAERDFTGDGQPMPPPVRRCR